MCCSRKTTCIRVILWTNFAKTVDPSGLKLIPITIFILIAQVKTKEYTPSPHSISNSYLGDYGEILELNSYI